MAGSSDFEKGNLLLFFLSSSSSSSDDEELIQLMEKRPSPKISNFIGDVVHKQNDEEFRRNFRMRRHTAYKLIDDFRNSKFCPTDSRHGGRTPISAEAHLLSFLWFAGNKSSIRDVSQRFSMTKSSLGRVIVRVTDFLLDLAPTIIKMPNEREVENFASEFQKVSGFPGVLGCIDGTSISIRTPAHKLKHTYTNRHDLPAITLQGICDYRRQFIDVFVGVPGKVHDARVLKLSPIYERLPALCGTKYNILGDGAYFIRTWLLVPYKDYGKLTAGQKKFNKTLSATRVLIENTFGILKGRFRQLHNVDMLSVEKIVRFIIACCVLHNLCIDADDYIETDEIVSPTDTDKEHSYEETEWHLRKKGEEKREAVKNMMEFTL